MAANSDSMGHQAAISDATVDPSTGRRTADASHAESIGDVVEEYLQLIRAGDEISPEDFAALFPEFADELRRVLPALVMLERAKSPSTGRPVNPAVNPSGDATGGAPRVLGDFRLVREIGRGGMGVVYEAVQESLERRVALKLLGPQALLDPKFVRRFQREARSAAQLHHTNIVPVFGAGEAQGQHYYVMQHIVGQGLDAVIRELRAAEAEDSRPTDDGEALAAGEREPRTIGVVETINDARPRDGSTVVNMDDVSALDQLDALACVSALSPASPRHWQNVARIGLEISEAVAFAHAHGTLHRDIKPSNVLIDTSGTAWISDFGLAKSVDEVDLTATGEVLGTLRYAPPEALRGQYDARSDVFSLGLTLYELCALRPAREAKSREHLLRQTAHESPLALGRVRPATPRDLQTIIHKAIEVDPSRRYQQASDLAADLRRFLNDQPIRARRIGALERTWRWCRRNPAISATTAAAATIVLTTTTVAILWINAARKDAVQAFENEQAERLKATNAGAEAKITASSLKLSNRKLEASIAEIQSQREIADKKAAEARKNLVFARNTVAQYLSLLGDSPELKAKGLDSLRRKLLENASEFYDQLAKENSDDPEVRSDRAEGYVRLGQFLQDTGQYREGLELMLKAEATLEELHREAPAVRQTIERLSQCHEAAARVLQKLGRLDESDAKQERCVTLIQSLVENSPTDFSTRFRLAKGYELLGVSYSQRDAGRRAVEPFEKSIAMYRDLLKQKPDHFEARREMAETLSNLGLIYLNSRRFADAELVLDEAIGILKVAHESRPNHVRTTSNLAIARGFVATLYDRTDRRDRAIESCKSAIELFGALAERRDEITMYQDYLAANLTKLGEMLVDKREFRDADTAFAQAVDIREKQVRKAPLPHYRVALVSSLRGRTMTQIEMGSMDEALRLIERAVEVAAQFNESERKQFVDSLDNALNQFQRARVLYNLKRDADAAKAFRQALADAERVYKADSTYAAAGTIVSRARYYLKQVELRAEKATPEDAGKAAPEESSKSPPKAPADAA